ncbi:hypothetical protein AAFC00_003518 [Neodothiora populina]|uniref:Uncharacterized protein n=1 Tax=Neodothiora populina TaxID=2781224 RepID=A0ABR3PFJ3_9PEZI
MRRKTAVASLIYARLFPDPEPEEPTSFQSHLARNLIPEVRVEVATFYGSLDSIEARYPGLNYCHPPHRLRLGRFPHHARLFQVIEELGLTPTEVHELARWEGTLWARQRFERDEGIKVRDTTGDGIIPWVDARLVKKAHDKGIRVKVETAVQVSQQSELDGPHDCQQYTPVEDFIDYDDSMAEGEAEGEDEVSAAEVDMPVPVPAVAAATTPENRATAQDLDRRVLAALAARQQGVIMDINPELEAYLKELVESGRFASRPADGPVSQAGPEVVVGGGPALRQPTA